MTELAFQYSVSDRTIRRDILFLSRYAPICTKTGLNGGAFLMDGYRKELMLHLSREEEALLLKIMRTLDEKEQHIVYNIINKYAMPKSSKGHSSMARTQRFFYNSKYIFPFRCKFKGVIA